MDNASLAKFEEHYVERYRAPLPDHLKRGVMELQCEEWMYDNSVFTYTLTQQVSSNY